MKKRIIFIVTILLMILLIPILTQKEKDLTLWENNSVNKKEIINYVKDVTKKTNKNYIPEEDRIAVFDLDGTLYCETDPTYLSIKLYANKIKNEFPELSERIMKKTITVDSKKTYEAYKNMTIQEYENYINEFLNTEEEGYTIIMKKQAFYKPMLELIEYLQKNNFKIYINSGTEYYLVKELIKDMIQIPENQIIGTEQEIIDERLIGKIIEKNINQNKVENIKKKIGKIPVLAFGNSSADFQMLNYIKENDKYKTKVFMIINDDNKRENGNLETANKIIKTSKENNWNTISMKNEWKTIYGKNVEKK